MNWIHRRLCKSDSWKKTVREALLPWALNGVDLGEEVLEIGPGPGVTTDLLRERCRHLTCIEIDARLAAQLSARMEGTNVVVRRGDAAQMPFAEGSFSGAACFTMLHHVPSRELQDRILREAYRVLRPGAWLAGSDSRLSLRFRLLHVGDTMVVSDPDEFGKRLEDAGFQDVSIALAARAFSFRARKA